MIKDYGQFCGLAKAASVLGERWALLVLRDLSLGPRRFSELQEGLPGIPTTVLTSRLRALEEQSVIERQAPPLGRPGLVYAMTDHGRELIPILDALGRWGARRMVDPGTHDVMTPSSLAGALRSAYRPGVIPVGVTIRVAAGPVLAWARTTPDGIAVGEGIPDGPVDLTITTGPAMRHVLAGTLSPSEALASGTLAFDGSRELFDLFPRAFHVPFDSTIDQGESA